MNANLHSFLSLGMLAILFSSYERLFDKDADYRYKIDNTTTSTVEVVVEIKQNPSVNIQGDPNRYYTIKPGGTAEVWPTSGFTTSEVHDEEKKHQEVYWINVTAISNGSDARSNLNSTERWEYKKENKYKVTYILTLTQDGF
jgi:hypothetical protein